MTQLRAIVDEIKRTTRLVRIKAQREMAVSREAITTSREAVRESRELVAAILGRKPLKRAS